MACEWEGHAELGHRKTLPAFRATAVLTESSTYHVPAADLDVVYSTELGVNIRLGEPRACMLCQGSSSCMKAAPADAVCDTTQHASHATCRPSGGADQQDGGGLPCGIHQHAKLRAWRGEHAQGLVLMVGRHGGLRMRLAMRLLEAGQPLLESHSLPVAPPSRRSHCCGHDTVATPLLPAMHPCRMR